MEEPKVGEGRTAQSPLQSDRVTATINDAMITSIAVVAMSYEAPGAELVVPGAWLPGDTPAVGEFFGGLAGSARNARGVFVEVGETRAAAELTVFEAYARSIPEVTKAPRANVIQHVESLTGLDASEANITLADVFFPEQ